MPTSVKILHTEPVTHDVRRYRVEKPDGFSFEPGQATDVALDKEGWREETRPFTFTALPDADTLEFTIKSYHDHDGVTHQLWSTQPGDALLIAGKGHETGQIVGDQVFPFDDAEQASVAVAALDGHPA